MALSDKEVGSIMSRLMAERSKKNGTGSENTDEAAEETAAEQVTGTSDGYDELLSDVLSGAETPSERTGSDGGVDNDTDSQRRVDDLYSEFASSVRDEGGEAGDEPEGDGEQTPGGEKAADDSESYLMAALGYSEAGGEAPEIKKDKPAAKPSLSARVSKADMASAFAWTGREYTSKSQRGDVLRAYDFERKKLYVRIFGTGLFFLLVLIFELFGDKFGGAFSKAEYPVVHIMTSLQLLLLCAVFSGKRLLSGFVDLFRGAPSIASLVSVSVGCAVVYDLISAAALGGSENIEFTLYNASAALSLVFLVVSDMIRLIAETRTFTKLSSFDSLCTLERVEDASGNAYRLHRGSFVRDYFKRTNRRGEGMKAGVYVIPAVFAIALILFFIALGSGRGFIPSLNTFICAVHFSLPAFAVIAFDLPFRILSLSRTGSYSVILNELDTAEFASVGKVVLDETDVFTGESLKINKVSQCVPHSNIFEILSVAGAVCSRVGGTLSRAFSTISETEDFSGDYDIEITGVSEGGIDAVIDGKIYTFGTLKYLSDRGIACRGCNDAEYASSTRGGTVFHIAVEGREVFRFFMQYVPDPAFIELVRGMAERGIGVEIRCKDPNLSAHFISSMIGDENVRPEVVRVAGELSGENGGAIEGGLIADGSEWMSVIRTADSCQAYRSVSKLNLGVQSAIAIIATVLAILLGVTGNLTDINPLIPALIQLLAVLPSALISRLIS